MKKLVFLLFWLFFLNISFASSWNLTWVNIITREQWKADDKYLFADYEEYKDLIKKNHENFLKIKKDRKKYKKYLENVAKNKEREKYLLTHWKDEVKADKVIKQLSGHKLWWNIAYKFNKDRIIIHHTASDYTKFKNPEDVKKFIRWIYYFHATKRGWWDIGYNFLIWPYGNIYEWRKWWEWVIWANSKWNNVPSIWIAVIWNFEIQKPTKKQVEALKKLTLALARKYNIDPYKEISYHKEKFKTSPYIKDVKNVSIVGHKDTWYTLCPWKNLYEILPSIRDYVAKNLKLKPKKSKIILASAKIPENKIINVWRKISLSDTLRFRIKSLPKIEHCSNTIPNIKITCYNNIITFKRLSDLKLDYKQFYVYYHNRRYTVKIEPIFMDDLRNIVKKKALRYLNYKTNKAKIQKIKYKVSLQEAKNIMKKDISVLLYDLSFLKHYDISCTKDCNVITDIASFKNVKKIQIDKVKGSMLIFVNNKYLGVRYIEIDSNWWEINIDNYKRKSYAGIKWNAFKWKILIKKDWIKNISNWKVYQQFVMINTLPVKDYLQWIAESNDNVPYEKAKVMALLVKSYIIFYFNKKNVHPSIPKQATYNAIDDPRSFQKYVWAGYERTAKQWKKVLKDTENLYIVYDNYIPILPYFSCSVWFTFSAKQKFGRIDTPYIKNNLDLPLCKKFYGHGVGLSWKWAEFLAKKWLKMKQILQWYFSGVKVVK